MQNAPIKVVDLFAGPGGLGEGFSRAGPDSHPFFKLVASVEMEANAHKTLSLRAFTREFSGRKIPRTYYAYLQGKVSIDELFSSHKSEWKAASVETLGRPARLGRDNEEIHRAIEVALEGNDLPWVLIGGPPCQAYSHIGRARNKGNKNYWPEKDERQELYQHYLEIVAKYSPAIFVMENVGGMLSAKLKGQKIIDQILSDVGQLAKVYGNSRALNYRFYSVSTLPTTDKKREEVYQPKDFIVKAEKYGVPQSRHRVILVGIRDDFDVNAKDLLLEESPVEPLINVIGDLPRLRSGLSREDSYGAWYQIANSATEEIAEFLGEGSLQAPYDSLGRGGKFLKSSKPFRKRLSSQLAKWFKDEDIRGVLDHGTRGHMDRDVARYMFVSYFGKKHGRSPRLSDFPEALLPKHKNVNSGKFVDRFKVQLPNRPSSTVTSHISKDGHYFIHYDARQCRSLSVREAARIQTFPDNYKFEGPRTSQYSQVGNAVPPYLAYQIANRIYEVLKKNI